MSQFDIQPNFPDKVYDTFKSVIKLQYKKESGVDMEIFRLNDKRISYCADVKADWNKRKIQKTKVSKEQ